MKKIFPVILTFVLLLSNSGFSQTLILNDFAKERTSFTFRYIRPDFEAFTVTPFSGIYDFKINLPISRKFDLVTSLPLVVYSRKISKTYYWGTDGNALGNWFLGIQSKPATDARTYYDFTFGVYLPTSSDKDYSPLEFAARAHFQENYKYNPHQLTIYGNYSRRYNYDDGVSMTWELGPQIYIPTKNNTSNGQLYFHYGISGTIESNRFFATAEFAGTVDLTHKYEYFDYRFIHFVAIGAGFSGPIFTPSIYFQIPAGKKEWYALPDYIFGIKMIVQTL